MPGEARVANGVNAPVEAVQTPSRRFLRDKLPREAETRELPGRNHTVLPARKLRQASILALRSFLVSHTGYKERTERDSPPLILRISR